MADQGDGALSRRGFIAGAGAAAAAAGLSQAAGAEAAPAFRRRGKLMRRPNFLVILADEYRYPTVYESRELRRYRAEHLTAEETMRDDAVELRNHYIMSAACAPSRSSFFTGQYPPLHGVSQTDGVAKGAVGEDMFWLDPNTVPTIGDYFRAGGYDTYYKGKWHVSHADIEIPGTNDQLVTFNDEGHRMPGRERTYERANRLDGYGFDGWIGPEPHGSNPLNSGSSASAGPGRDVKYAEQTVELLRDLRHRRGRPWLAVSSFVNPHDIVLWGEITLRQPKWNLLGQLDHSKVPRRLFDERQYRATSEEDLRSKPTAQRSYNETYPKMLQPSPNTLDYRRFYYQLQRNVNRQIQKVLDTLAADREMARDTIVIFTSDHGDLLGAHGGMHQKWHQAYEEATHVPFMVKNPRAFSGRTCIDALTSHADVLPTLLGLAGLHPGRLRKQLRRTHDEVHPLVGRDLSGLLLGEVDPDHVRAPVYFMTDDDVSHGENQVGYDNHMYRSVKQPNQLETVIANLPTGAGGRLQKWKYTRYYDSPQYWSQPRDEPPSVHLPPTLPSKGKDVATLVSGNVQRSGAKRAITKVKRRPARDQIEAYNVSSDPLELDNLARSKDRTTRAVLKQLRKLLEEQCRDKRRKPHSGEVPGQMDC